MPKPQKDNKGRFITGNSGGGRPKGSRNKLGEAFVQDLYADWSKHGTDAIRAARSEDPAAYLRVIAGLLPKEMHIKDETLDHLTDDELSDAVQAIIAARAGRARAKATNGIKAPTGNAESDSFH